MRLVKILLTIITLVCIYIIMYVGLGYGWPIGVCENYQRINSVLLNLSYSYMAGLVFYLFTSTLPHLINADKLKTVIKEKESIIYGRLEDCVKAAYSANDEIPGYSKESLAKQYECHKMSDPCYYLIFSLKQYLQLQRSNITDIINGLLVYADYLPSDELQTLEKVKDSQFFSQISVFQWEEMDEPEQRRKAGEYLYDLIEQTSKFKKTNNYDKI